MADKSNSEKEYELKGDESLIAETPPLGTPISQPRSINKRMLVPIIIVTAVSIIYSFLNWSSSRKAAAEKMEVVPPKKEVVAPQPIVQPQPQPVVVAPPSISPELSDKILSAQSDLQQRIGDLMAREDSYREQISNLNTKIVQNQDNIAAINKNLTEISASLQNVVDDIKKLTVPKKVKIAKKKPIPLPSYHIRAMVAGRAWLETDKGKSFTVRVGDELPSYGNVVAISPRQGMVLTSTGATITYGSNDI